ncbi:MAG: SEC-C domain-containing protein [Acidobacteria bacterium]|nr:SEC-C domain-containing protein [Acidobacteriota bacterium]
MSHCDLGSLTPAQAQAALSLASGASISHAAHSAGVVRSTLNLWLKNIDFANIVEEAKQEFIENLRDQLREASQKALNTIIAILDDPVAPSGVRLKAALAVLKRPHAPDAGWQLPVPLESPQSQEDKTLSFEEKSACYQTKSDTFEQESPDPPTEPEPIRAEPQTNTQPFVNTSKIGRNETCPCGSGLKFKRCCLNKPHRAVAA